MEVRVPESKIMRKISLRGKTTALLIADMLVDFVHPEGKLFVPEAPGTVFPIKNLARRARKSGAAVVYIQDWHRPDDPKFSIWGPHAVQDSAGTNIVAELAPSPRDAVVRKRTYDPFFGTDLDLLLRQKSIRTVVVTGTVANICVLHAAGSAALRGYEVVVPVDAISALDPFDFESALRQISFVYKGKLTRSENLSFRA
ncbi:MAG TPA: isochorismatase family cysteine hydrolase [Thermodesulfobacteriota bacterium]|nr:isochorismatase family cysteine hydrolase [Thermodesulfobacteriota bacterium]